MILGRGRTDCTDASCQGLGTRTPETPIHRDLARQASHPGLTRPEKEAFSQPTALRFSIDRLFVVIPELSLLLVPS